jgi:hypothetical protein
MWRQWTVKSSISTLRSRACLISSLPIAKAPIATHGQGPDGKSARGERWRAYWRQSDRLQALHWQVGMHASPLVARRIGEFARDA